ncbi:unnamed protein product [Clonostachys chloroleuca]|uniref:Translation machinery-associated protein 17 n=1 Tax=Clonostachys chloroleuca TaxID=1926264 RepID=A0AA35MFW6_9HYPO|nr:unnamed protein product [Clonostachys chloroleuca]
MSADTTPISPSRFAAALKDLSISMLHLKSLEIRNSIAHLQYSNDQLRPFAEGSATALSSSSTPAAADDAPAQPDQDCIDAIRENETVIDRMAERIALIRAEVEERGVAWVDFQSMDEARETTDRIDGPAQHKTSQAVANGVSAGESSTQNGEPQSSPWTDGTFQTGTISNGQVTLDGQPNGRPAQGGSLTDEQLRAALAERLGDISNEDEDESGGLHL